MSEQTNPSWSTFADVLGVLQRRWQRGTYLTALADDTGWTVVTIPIKGPTKDDLDRDLGSVLEWAEQFFADSRRRAGSAVVELRSLRSRAIGSNDVPIRVRIDTFGQLAELLGVKAEVEASMAAIDATSARLPAARAWVSSHPFVTIEHRDDWDRILDVACWIVDNDVSASMLRHVDLQGIDTKFIERHRKIIAQLLDLSLPVHRVRSDTTDFADRYGFRSKPVYVQFRLLCPVPELPADLTELTVRAEELDRRPLGVRRVFIVENQASYLAFPDVPSSMVVFGQGFKVSTIDAVSWFAEREVIYWGDIDTHGFAILDLVRRRLPSVRSILMDRATLVAHLDHVGIEERPMRGPLLHLNATEAATFNDLVEDRYGHHVRLEQERIRFSAVRRALGPWSHESP